MPTVFDVMAAMRTVAPEKFAVPGDRERIGLHCGDGAKKVAKVALALDASLGAVEEAREWGADMLVVHHPRFYGGIRTLTEDDPAGQRAVAIVKSGMAVYSAHTNLDVAEGGVNDQLALAMGLKNCEILVPTVEERLLKLVVFVPTSHEEKVRGALDKAGAGAIGKYSGCTFRSQGTGTFRCGPGTKPFQGKPGTFEEAEEYRLETVFGEFSEHAVLRAMLDAHPYEEVAYDVYPVRGKGKVYGFGRCGLLPKGERLSELAARAAKATGSPMTQYSGKPGRQVSRVAVWAGAGLRYEEIREWNIDAIIAGEVGYHEIETFNDYGVDVITVGHGYSEELALKPLAKRLKKLLPTITFTVLRPGRIGMRNA